MVGDPIQALLPLRIGPADPAVPDAHPERPRRPADPRQPRLAADRDMAQGAIVEAPEREIVLRRHQPVPAPLLVRVANRPYPNLTQIPVILFHGRDHNRGEFACSYPNGKNRRKRCPPPSSSTITAKYGFCGVLARDAPGLQFCDA